MRPHDLALRCYVDKQKELKSAKEVIDCTALFATAAQLERV